MPSFAQDDLSFSKEGKGRGLDTAVPRLWSGYGWAFSCPDSESETISDVSDVYHMLWVMCFPSLCSVVSLVFLFGLNIWPCNANRCSGAPKGKCHILFFHDLIDIFLKNT